MIGDEFNFENLKILIEKGKFIYIVSDENFITKAVNPYFTELTGYTPQEIVGEKSTEVLDPPDIRRQVEKRLKELKTKGKFQINENPIITKDGKIKHILWYNVWDEKNKDHISIGIDITDLRETEQKLRERDEYLLRLTGEAGAFMWRTLIKGDKEKTVYYTESIEEVLGYPKEYFLNEDFIPMEDAPFRKIIYPDDLPRFEQEAKRCLLNGEPIREELRVIKRDGGIVWLYEYLMPILRDEKVKEVIGIGIDITEKKKQELVLKEKNEELEFLLNTINAYIFRLILYPDGSYKVLFYSDGIKNVTGYTKEEFYSGKVRWEDIVYPPDREPHRRKVEVELLKGNSTSLEYRIRRKDGKLIWVVDSIRPILRDDGKIEVIGVCVDIDEKKKAEEEKKILEKLQTIGFIAGNLSHVFNNILTGILGYTSLMKVKLSPHSTDYNILSRIESGIEKMVDMNNKLLAYARLGKYRENIIDLDILIGEVVKSFEESEEVKGISIIPILSPYKCKVKGDENQLKMVFKIILEEFLQNSIEGSHIKIKTGIKEIEDKNMKRPYIVPGKYTEIIVETDGFAISEEEIKTIFEPTSAPDKLYSDRILSFPAVYGAVKSHGGFIYIESKDRKSTSLIIYLPLVE